jgi:hypothetical protein
MSLLFWTSRVEDAANHEPIGLSRNDARRMLLLPVFGGFYFAPIRPRWITGRLTKVELRSSGQVQTLYNHQTAELLNPGNVLSHNLDRPEAPVTVVVLS